LDAGFKAICTHRRKARRREPALLLSGPPDDAMHKVKRDDLPGRPEAIRRLV
jgi:hypothetical protein